MEECQCVGTTGCRIAVDDRFHMVTDQKGRSVSSKFTRYSLSHVLTMFA